jgi:ubiquinone/menaquinone biosynthesis C-methylase UbiE
MSKYSYDPKAYEKRYRKVYEIGAEFWEQSEPTKTIAKFISEIRVPKRSRVIEFGCGEGRDSVFLSRKGFRVLGMDTARSALVKAKWRSKKERTAAEFIVADIRSLPTKDRVFDLAINVACLHMITDQENRDRHLRESKRVMKVGGKYLSCNLAVDKEISVKEFYRGRTEKPGTLTSRKINANRQVREVSLPVIAAWPKSRTQYVEEFENASFQVTKITRADVKPIGECWVLMARKKRT